MHWIDQYQVILLDFDGLLVNTEKLHYKAYQRFCQKRGFSLPWDFETYCQYAHFSATALKENIYALFPKLLHQENRWEVLYQEKKDAYQEILREETIELMPGVGPFLERLDMSKIICSVVTHSTREQITLVKEKNSLISSIPHFITREDYGDPKPSSASYDLAIQRFVKPGMRAIGFEDSLRGLTALINSDADAVLVSSLLKQNEVEQFEKSFQKPFRFYPSFEKILV